MEKVIKFCYCVVMLGLVAMFVSLTIDLIAKPEILFPKADAADVVLPLASTIPGGQPYSQRVVEASVRGIAYRQLTDLSSAQWLPVVDGADRVSIQAESQNIRLRLRADGVDPTATVGALIHAGTWYDYPGDPTDPRIIEAAASGTANLLYFDYGP